MEEEISVYVVRFGNRPNFALQWRDPITRKLKTKTTKIPASRLARDRKAAERLAGELQAQLAAGSAAIPSTGPRLPQKSPTITRTVVPSSSVISGMSPDLTS